MDFSYIWARIENCAGQQFYTKTGLPFTYEIVNGSVVPDRTGYALSRGNFEKASKIDSLQRPGQINNIVRGPSYVFAILTDERIK